MTPAHVTFYLYDSKSKQHERYDALVIGSHALEEHDYPVLNLVHFRHNDPASHHALMGVDWADTLERTLDVPHHDDLGNQAFYYVDSEADGLRSELQAAYNRLDELTAESIALKVELAASTEGTDKALQAEADRTASTQPSAADLDRIAEEQQAREATARHEAEPI